jgi:hypothetical protein
MRRLLAAFLIVLALAPAAHASDGITVQRNVWVRATATIGADGRIETLEWKVPDVDPARLAATLEPRVREWEFEPALVDGVPTRVKTGLNVFVALLRNKAGGWDFRVLDARVAPLFTFKPTPHYPPQALRGNKEAFVDATLRVAADGATVVEAVDVRANGHSALFEARVRETLKAWILEPEVVGGVAVESRVRVPVSFCLPLKRSWCARQRAEGKGPTPGGEPVAVDPRVRLKTDVREPGA